MSSSFSPSISLGFEPTFNNIMQYAKDNSDVYWDRRSKYPKSQAFTATIGATVAAVPIELLAALENLIKLPFIAASALIIEIPLVIAGYTIKVLSCGYYGQRLINLQKNVPGVIDFIYTAYKVVGLVAGTLCTATLGLFVSTQLNYKIHQALSLLDIRQLNPLYFAAKQVEQKLSDNRWKMDNNEQNQGTIRELRGIIENLKVRVNELEGALEGRDRDLRQWRNHTCRERERVVVQREERIALTFNDFIREMGSNRTLNLEFHEYLNGILGKTELEEMRKKADRLEELLRGNLGNLSESEKEELEIIIEELKTKNLALDKRLGEVQGELEKEQLELKAARAVIERQEKEIEELTRTNKSLERDINQFSNQLHDEKQAKTELEKERVKLMGAIKEKSGELELLKKELQGKNEGIAQLKNEMSAEREKYGKLIEQSKKEMEELHSKLEEVRKEIEGRAIKFEELRKQHEELTKKYDTAKRENEVLKGKLDELEKAGKGFQSATLSEAKAKEGELEELRKQIEQLEGELSAQKDVSSALEEKGKSLQERIKAQEVLLAEQEKKLEGVSEKLQAKVEELEQMKKLKEEFEEKTKVQAEEIQQLKIEYIGKFAAQASEIEELAMAKKRLEKQLQALQEGILSLVTQIHVIFKEGKDDSTAWDLIRASSIIDKPAEEQLIELEGWIQTLKIKIEGILDKERGIEAHKVLLEKQIKTLSDELEGKRAEVLEFKEKFEEAQLSFNKETAAHLATKGSIQENEELHKVKLEEKEKEMERIRKAFRSKKKQLSDLKINTKAQIDGLQAACEDLKKEKAVLAGIHERFEALQRTHSELVSREEKLKYEKNQETIAGEKKLALAKKLERENSVLESKVASGDDSIDSHQEIHASLEKAKNELQERVIKQEETNEELKGRVNKLTKQFEQQEEVVALERSKAEAASKRKAEYKEKLGKIQETLKIVVPLLSSEKFAEFMKQNQEELAQLQLLAEIDSSDSTDDLDFSEEEPFVQDGTVEY